jgi:two-component system LytT family response regulator
MEDLLLPFGFVRVHHSHLINLKYVTRFVKSDGGYIEMSSAAQIPVSRSRRENIIELLTKKM